MRVILCTAVVLIAASAPSAARAADTKIVSYHGYRLVVPADWPVFRLAQQPATCVRFNRHAVYLGDPGADQICPPDAAGRTEAILVEPVGAVAPRGLDAGATVRLRVRQAGVLVTATWDRRPGVIRRALGVRSLLAYQRSASVSPPPAWFYLRRRVGRERSALVSPAGGPASPGSVFDGLGFDACSAPSFTAMGDWSASPYGAVGIYIGGANAACAQPNLTATWVSTVSAAGWHLLPIYVGLQAPGNSCGCAAITPASAASEGTAAAVNAVAQAQALGLGSGNPIFFDMESYARGGSVTSSVLSFLEAWSVQLNGDGYLSGVYSSEDSGISDLVAQATSGYAEPNEIWIANWNGEDSTDDPVVPVGEWTGQRLHQYQPAAEQTYGGFTIDVDPDAVDAATAGSGTAAGSQTPSGGTTTAAPGPPEATVAQVPPSASSVPTIAGAALMGQTLSEAHATWSGNPSTFGYQWEDCAEAGEACTAIAGATAPTYRVAATDVGAAVRVVETASNAGGAGTPAISAATAVVKSTPSSGYWLVTSVGNVEQSPGMSWFGSALGTGVTSIAGMAPTPNRHGYWLVDRAGRVFSYGNARLVAPGRYGRPISGIVGSFRGAWLYTSSGNVFSVAGAPWYGSPLHQHSSPIVGMAATRNGRGYWLVDSAGQIFSYGDAPALAAVQATSPISGIVSAPGGGAWLFTRSGDVLPVGGAVSFGSPALAGISSPEITGMRPTIDGLGYWLVNRYGEVYAYGDAATFSVPSHGHQVVAINS